MEQVDGNTDQPDRLTELEADNKRLRRLLDQRDAPGELRHRLHNTLAMLRTIIRKSAETQRDLEAYVGHIEDRLDALARAQASIDERGSISLHELITDELLHYGAVEGERLVLSGREAELKPRAGQVLALAVHELAVNAVEHGSLGEVGQVEVTCSAEEEAGAPVLSVTWQERQGPRVSPPSREGFGTEVLTRTLAYELRAVTDLAYEPDGARCTIRIPLSERIGRLAD